MGLADFVKKQFIDVIQWTEEATTSSPGGSRPPTSRSSRARSSSSATPRRRLRRRGPGRRPLRARPPRDPDPEPAGADRPAPLGQAVRVAVQERGLLLLDAAPPGPDLGHAEPDHHARRRVRRGARARLRRSTASASPTPAASTSSVSGTRESYRVADLEGQLRGTLVSTLADHFGESGVPFLDMAANQAGSAAAVRERARAAARRLGARARDVQIQSLSLPDELQQRLDERIGMGMVGDLGPLHAVPGGAVDPTRGGERGRRRAAGAGVGVGAGIAMGQAMAQAMSRSRPSRGGRGRRSRGGAVVPPAARRGSTAQPVLPGVRQPSGLDSAPCARRSAPNARVPRSAVPRS